MNRCRRILAAALAAVMLLALTACGQSTDTNNSAEQTVVRIGTPATGDHGARMLEAARVAADAIKIDVNIPLPQLDVIT